MKKSGGIWFVGLFAVSLGAVVLGGALFGFTERVSMPTVASSASHGDARRRPLVMAHRGGGGLWPENTLHAFTQAAAMGVDVLEMDLHATADGHLVVIHDGTLDRTTNGTGRVNMLALAEVKKLDAGHHWTKDGGRTYPFRGRGLSVPTLPEVLARFPDMRFNLDIKQAQPSLVKSFCRTLREGGATRRVIVGSFSSQAIEEFRRECPEVPTSASPDDLRALLVGGDAARNVPADTPLPMRALQVPEYAGGRLLLEASFVEAAHRRGLEVHVWTINDEEGMRRVLALGVDGIITDYPNVLIELLNRREPPRK